MRGNQMVVQRQKVWIGSQIPTDLDEHPKEYIYFKETHTHAHTCTHTHAHIKESEQIVLMTLKQSIRFN